jgi:hypothetical protein
VETSLPEHLLPLPSQTHQGLPPHPNLPALPGHLLEIRELRNRTFHPEAIWDRNLPRSHRRIVDVLGWMNQGLAGAVRHLSRLDATYEGGLQGFRGEAERIVRP